MNQVKKRIATIPGFFIIWIIMLGIIAIFTFVAYQANENQNMIDNAEFMENVKMIQNKDKVGAKIWLKEAIHGTNGIKYRYAVETDCPKWNFETKYMTDTPIEWVDGKTSAVEVLIYDEQVRYDDTVYASGTYYTVPILDNISSENVSLEEWEQNLTKQAYQTFISENSRMSYQQIGLFVIFGLFIIILFVLLIKPRILQKKNKNNVKE